MRRLWPLAAALLAFAVLIFHGAAALAAGSTVTARDYKMAGDATRTRVVLNFDREPEPHWFLLRGPHRLVIDLPDTKLLLDPKELKARGLVKGVRYGAQ